MAKFTVFKDLVGVIYEDDKPSVVVLKDGKHEVFFRLTEIKGDTLINILQGMTAQAPEIK